MSLLLFVVFVYIFFNFSIVTINCNKNNVCPASRDYYTKEINPRCWYDPDVFSDAIELLDRYKYNYNVHTTVTEDGYILNNYRLLPKNNNPKGIVFLAHCATSNMIMWIDKGKKSIAFMLVDEGYDVWLGNFRGTPYSDNHTTLSKELQPNKYWNHSFHEMGIYDVPVQLELVRNVSGSSSKIYYVGHSLGSTAASIYASLLPNHAKEYVHLFILWAPSAFINVDKSIYRFIAPFANQLLKLVNLFHLGNVFATSRLHLLLYYVVFEFPRMPELFAIILDLLFGLDPKNSYPPLHPAIPVHNGYGCSAKLAVHYAQLYNSRRFQWFDYGKDNEYYYNSPTPPEYPIENITTPMYFFCGLTDAISPIKENLHLYNLLQPESRYGIKEVGYNHDNFLYGKNLVQKLFIPTIDVIKGFETNGTNK